MTLLIDAINAAVMRSAQRTRDNSEPAPVDDTLLTEAEAIEQARDEIAATPQAIGQWLHNECWDDNEALDTRALRRACTIRALSVPECVVMLMLGKDTEALHAAHTLREAMRAQLAPDVRQRADELLAEQRRQRTREVEEAMAERYECGGRY